MGTHTVVGDSRIAFLMACTCASVAESKFGAVVSDSGNARGSNAFEATLNMGGDVGSSALASSRAAQARSSLTSLAAAELNCTSHGGSLSSCHILYVLRHTNPRRPAECFRIFDLRVRVVRLTALALGLLLRSDRAAYHTREANIQNKRVQALAHLALAARSSVRVLFSEGVRLGEELGSTECCFLGSRASGTWQRRLVLQASVETELGMKLTRAALWLEDVHVSGL